MSNVEKHVPGTVAWVDLMTHDVKAACDFYGGLFGWTFDVGPAESHYYTMCKAGGRNAAGMGELPKDNPFPPSWNIYFAVEDADQTAERIKASGGTMAMEPFDVMDQGRMAFAFDSTGGAFGIWQSRRHTGAVVVDEPSAMCWHELNTRDVSKAKDFYGAVFGLEARDMSPEQCADAGAPDMYYYTYTLHRGPKAVGGVLQMGERWPAEVPTHWNTYFAVSATDESAAKVEKLGGKVLVQPFDTPFGRMAVVQDPWGAAFTLIVPSELAQSI